MVEAETTQPFAGVQLGVLAPTLQEQFAAMLPREARADLAQYQRDNEALSRVHLRGLITADSVIDKARNRLVDKVIQLLLKHAAIVERKP